MKINKYKLNEIKSMIIDEDKLGNNVKETNKKVFNEAPALMTNYGTSHSRNILNEMARLNKKDDSQSPFPGNNYKIWVQGDNSSHKPPHMHIYYPKDGWEIKVFIGNGQLWQVVSYGNRGKRDMFSDIIRKVQQWFLLDTRMPGRFGTNQEAALHEWDACNDD